jgi:ubiquitin carboxyl-terminal hydrolase 9/24
VRGLLVSRLIAFNKSLFRLIADGALNNNSCSGVLNSQIRNTANPKCDTAESRNAAYTLLCQLSKDNAENTKILVDQLIQLHLKYDESLINEKFEFEPPIERRDPSSNFVGLKNAGATCYMNSVIQILNTFFSLQVLGVDFENDLPSNEEVTTSIEDTVFGQLQNVFGHLLESKLKYYVPEKFWRCFRLFGQPVNVREQQDAFEFFTQIVDQVDEYLMAHKKPKIFSKKFEGVFSDQKICQGCPHRYEREQTFMALNLTVKSNDLQESLDQFVKGELLEGDNAY